MNILKLIFLYYGYVRKNVAYMCVFREDLDAMRFL